MIWPDTHTFTPSATIAGATDAPKIIIVNGYDIEFEDGQYTVRVEGSNNNFHDVGAGVLVQNQVQVIPTNSFGLITGYPRLGPFHGPGYQAGRDS